MLIAVLARFLVEISTTDTDSSSMQYCQKCSPLGLSLYYMHFISRWKDSSSTSFIDRQFHDVVRKELSRPHRVDRVFGHKTWLQCCCFSRQTPHWAALVLFYKTTKPKSIFDLRIFSMPTQTANKRLRTFYRLSPGLSFIFNKTVLCDYLYYQNTANVYRRQAHLFSFFKSPNQTSEMYLFHAVA